ncbi:hypothetical protein [Pontibacter qinzhouensis]
MNRCSVVLWSVVNET